jgi:hypothetical protein
MFRESIELGEALTVAFALAWSLYSCAAWRG